MGPLYYLNATCGLGYYTEHQKTSGVFLFLVQTNFFCCSSKTNDKGLACQGNFVVTQCFIQVFESRRLRSMLQTISITEYHFSNYNHGHNNLRLFVTLRNFLFTTSERQRDYQQSSCLRVAERLKSQEIRKDQENLKISQNYTLVSSLPPKIKLLLLLARNC